MIVQLRAILRLGAYLEQMVDLQPNFAGGHRLPQNVAVFELREIGPSLLDAVVGDVGEDIVRVFGGGLRCDLLLFPRFREVAADGNAKLHG